MDTIETFLDNMFARRAAGGPGALGGAPARP